MKKQLQIENSGLVKTCDEYVHSRISNISTNLRSLDIQNISALRPALEFEHDDKLDNWRPPIGPNIDCGTYGCTVSLIQLIWIHPCLKKQ